MTTIETTGTGTVDPFDDDERIVAPDETQANPLVGQVMDLHEAVEAVGVGGGLRRNNTRFTVGRDEDGDWTLLQHNGNSDETMGRPRTLEAWVRERWEIASVSDSADTPDTFRGFFQNLDYFTIIRRPSNGMEYVFVDWTDIPDPAHEDDSLGYTVRVPRLIHSRFMAVETLDPTMLDSNNFRYVIATEDDGLPQTVDTFGRHAIRQLIGTRLELTQLDTARTQERSDLLNQLEEWAADYDTVNQRINDYADEMNMCGDYERRIFGWNDGTRRDRRGDTPRALVHKLVGRQKQHHVRVDLAGAPEGYTEFYVYVQARSPEEARDTVRSMTTRDIIANLTEHGQEVNMTFSVNDTTPTF